MLGQRNKLEVNYEQRSRTVETRMMLQAESAVCVHTHQTIQSRNQQIKQCLIYISVWRDVKSSAKQPNQQDVLEGIKSDYFISGLTWSQV